MGRIRVLADPLINRIAAGEVVERPASVVKELVENAIDAEARSVEVSCEGGGRRSIRIRDDGCGMDRDDALLSLERHATSKLRSKEDLAAIASLGFRGEALSSIAAVSRMVLQTGTGDAPGTRIDIHGGTIRQVREIGLFRGTTIEVAGLFFNLPARRKFLRTEATELGHVARIVTRYALAYPRLRFRLRHGERKLLQVDPSAALDERVSQIYGREFCSKLLAFDRSVGDLRIHGLAGRPMDALPRRDGQHCFVNGRAVQDRTLSHAVHEAYGNTMPRGRFPAIFLFLELEPGAVDVNVHPQKSEVRFRESGRVHDAVRDILRSALNQESVVPTLSDLRPGASLPRDEGREIRGAVARYLERGEQRPAMLTVAERSVPARSGSFGDGPSGETARGERPQQSTLDRGASASSSVVPLAQYRDSYIVAQDREGLVLIDQHAAHERVIFERYLEEARENRVEVQRLLFPVTLDLPADQRLALEQNLEEFRRLGFLVEAFGGPAVRVDGVPALAAEVEPKSLIAELLDEVVRARGVVAEASGLRHKLVTSAACQAAIKVNHPLTVPAMQRLVDDLYATVSPSTCPHGRPLLFRLGHEEIERAFRRR